VSAIAKLGFPAPRCEAAVELTRLLGARDELEAKLDARDREQRAAAKTLAQRSGELTALEKRALEGEQVSAAQRGKAEDALAKAKVAAAAPWGERRSAIQQAIDGHRGRVQAFTADHFGELVEEIEQDGAAAARAVDAAAETLVAAYLERAAASQRLDTLIASVNGASRFGDVALSRADAIFREASRMLQEGGEAAPIVRNGIVPGRDLAEDDSQMEEEVPAA
jgi:hypothetical protein